MNDMAPMSREYANSHTLHRYDSIDFRVVSFFSAGKRAKVDKKKRINLYALVTDRTLTHTHSHNRWHSE